MNVRKGISFIIVFGIIVAIICALLIGFSLGQFAKPTEELVKTETATKTITIKEIIEKTLKETITTAYISIQTITTTMPYTPTQTLKEEKFYYMLGEKIEVDNWEIIASEVKRVDNIIILGTSDPTYGTLFMGGNILP
jgi:hypothetical protein